ncbi:CLUMA_CG014847, isoform A [Clunio marinus]|uniref:CLUMA_CG014847, isoform A n=1 Tax=Clunio marinus TaxID=568069 RepID=A0A1J1IQJ4_9DIPT|nr:CLUMA_CG014847, isoform A [Clunio marinus]
MTSLGEHKEIYDEFKEIRDIQFNYHKEKHSLENVQELAINMKYFKDDDIIIGKEFCPEIDEMTLKDFIEKINERKFNLMILSHDYPRYDQTEQWFGTEYAKIEPDLDHEKPLLMFQNDFCKSFFKPDTKFRLPHGFVYIHFRCNLTESSISNLNMTSIYSICIKNFLTETFYPATVAGYSYKLNSVDDGLILKLNGFSEKLPQLVEAIMNAIRSTNESIDISVFEAFAKELKKNCYNFLINSNFLSEELRLNIIKPNHMFYFNRFKDADKISYSKFKEFLAMLFKCVNVRILIQGNFSKCQALQITEKILSHFNDEKISYKIPEDANACQIPTEASYLRVKSFLPHDQNSVIKNYYQVGGSTMESDCLLELLVKIMKEPLFNYIRTEQQLGYSVICLSKKDKNVIGMTITVETQEKKNSARIVDEKIESFLKNFNQNLTNIDEKDFEMLKKSIINHKRISVDDLETEVNFNWNEIRKNSLMFDRNDIEARQMELLTKNDLVTFYYDHFQGNYVRKLSIQVISNTDDNDSLLHHGFLHLNLISDENHKTISDVMKYKHSLAPCV